jgi:hypothetical protein
MSSWRANHISSTVRAVGGKLSIEGDRLVFRPHAFDKALAAREWGVALSEISAVEVAPRAPLSHLFAAGLRRQLAITAGGEETRFIVNRVERVADEIRAAAGAG